MSCKRGTAVRFSMKSPSWESGTESAWAVSDIQFNMAPKSRRSKKSIPSCKHGMKSHCHTGIKLAPVRDFTCKHPLKEVVHQALYSGKVWGNRFFSILYTLCRSLQQTVLNFHTLSNDAGFGCLCNHKKNSHLQRDTHKEPRYHSLHLCLLVSPWLPVRRPL